MPSNYPGGLDSLTTNNQDNTPSPTTHPKLHNDANDAINKIERELGTNPKGTFSSVAARLQARPVQVPVLGEVGASISNAIQQSQASGGGKVELTKGVGILESPLILRTGVYVVGEGEEATILKGKNGTLHNLAQTANFENLVGTDANAGEYNWGLESLTLDGNAAQRADGRGVAIYGKAYRLMHFIIRNTPNEGLFSEWYSGGDEMECQIAHFKIWRSKMNGLHFKGPHDSVIMDGQVIASGYGGDGSWVGGLFLDSGKAAGTQVVAVHSWGIEHHTAVYTTTNGTQLLACQGEGAQQAQLVLDAQDCVIMGGHYFGIGAGDDSTALVVGDSSTGGYPAKNLFHTKLSGSSKLAKFVREGGRNVFKLVCVPTETGVVVEGQPHESDILEILTDSDNWPADSQSQSSGIVRHTLPNLDNSAILQRATEGAPEDLIEIDTQADPTIKFHGMWYEAVESDGTPAWEIAPDGAAIFTKSNPITMQNGSVGVTELGGDPVGEANRALLYARDNGSGKTRLMARFGTGAPVQVAIEP